MCLHPQLKIVPSNCTFCSCLSLSEATVRSCFREIGFGPFSDDYWQENKRINARHFLHFSHTPPRWRSAAGLHRLSSALISNNVSYLDEIFFTFLFPFNCRLNKHPEGTLSRAHAVATVTAVNSPVLPAVLRGGLTVTSENILLFKNIIYFNKVLVWGFPSVPASFYSFDWLLISHLQRQACCGPTRLHLSLRVGLLQLFIRRLLLPSGVCLQLLQLCDRQRAASLTDRRRVVWITAGIHLTFSRTDRSTKSWVKIQYRRNTGRKSCYCLAVWCCVAWRRFLIHAPVV